MNREVRRLLAKGFAQQALADLTGYQQLCRIGGLPVCHRLHFLQMALEKLAKSFLWAADGERDADLRFSHNVIAKLLPPVLKKEWGGRSGGISRSRCGSAGSAVKSTCCILRSMRGNRVPTIASIPGSNPQTPVPCCMCLPVNSSG